MNSSSRKRKWDLSFNVTPLAFQGRTAKGRLNLDIFHHTLPYLKYDLLQQLTKDLASINKLASAMAQYQIDQMVPCVLIPKRVRRVYRCHRAVELALSKHPSIVIIFQDIQKEYCSDDNELDVQHVHALVQKHGNTVLDVISTLHVRLQSYRPSRTTYVIHARPDQVEAWAHEREIHGISEIADAKIKQRSKKGNKVHYNVALKQAFKCAGPNRTIRPFVARIRHVRGDFFYESIMTFETVTDLLRWRLPE
jgi:hypothetical protein